MADQNPASPASPAVEASEPQSTISAEDQAFAQSYKSYADEMDARGQQQSAQQTETTKAPELSPEEQEFAASYRSYADEIETPRQESSQRTAQPKEQAAPQRDQRTFEDPEKHLRRQQEKVQPQPGMHLRMDTPLGRAVDANEFTQQRADLHKAAKEAAEARDRQAFMERMSEREHDLERED